MLAPNFTNPLGLLLLALSSPPLCPCAQNAAVASPLALGLSSAETYPALVSSFPHLALGSNEPNRLVVAKAGGTKMAVAQKHVPKRGHV